MTLAGTGLGSAVNLTPTGLTFTGEDPGSTSAAHTVKLTNSGNVALAVSSITIGGTNRGDFAQTHNCGSSVAASARCTIEVTFTPTAAGSRSGTLNITDNAQGSPQTVALAGSGADFTIAMGTNSSTTATVTAGQTATYTLSLTGTQGFAGAVSLTCAGAPQLSTCTVTPPSVSLSGTNAVAATVSVTTTGRSVVVPGWQQRPPGGGPFPSSSRPGKRRRLPWSLSLLALAIMIGIIGAARGRATAGRAPDGLGIRLGFVTVMLVLGTLSTPSCGGGGGGGNPGTPAGAYSLSVTATFTSGTATLAHNIVLTLTVN